MLGLITAMLEGGMQSARVSDQLLEALTDSYHYITKVLIFCAVCIKASSLSCLRQFQMADTKLDGFISVTSL